MVSTVVSTIVAAIVSAVVSAIVSAIVSGVRFFGFGVCRGRVGRGSSTAIYSPELSHAGGPEGRRINSIN